MSLHFALGKGDVKNMFFFHSSIQLRKIKIGSTPDNYDKVDLQTSPDGYDETMFSEYFNRGLSGEPCEPPPAHVNCANCPEHLQRTINAATWLMATYANMRKQCFGIYMKLPKWCEIVFCSP